MEREQKWLVVVFLPFQASLSKPKAILCRLSAPVTLDLQDPKDLASRQRHEGSWLTAWKLPPPPPVPENCSWYCRWDIDVSGGMFSNRRYLAPKWISDTACSTLWEASSRCPRRLHARPSLNTIAPSYLQRIHPKIPSRCLKLHIGSNLTDGMFLPMYTYMPMIKFNL